MSENIHLIGAEDVARAGSTIQSAAETMSRTQDYMHESLRNFLMRFEELVVRMENATAPKGAAHQGHCVARDCYNERMPHSERCADHG